MPQRANITDLTIRAAKPPEKGTATIWDGAMRNFGVRVTSTGVKSFIILHGQGRRQVIGRYPVISLAQARDKASKLFAEKTLGRHAPSSMTWEAATAEWLGQVQRDRRSRTYDDYKRSLSLFFPFTGKLTEITKQQVAKKLDRIADRPTQLKNALVVLKIFFRWAISRGYVDHNPVTGFQPQKQHSRTRVLSDDELRRVWIAAGKLGTFGTITRLLILTGQRRNEVAALQTSWVKNNTITLPAAITKNGKEHTFPLSSLAWTIVSQTTQSLMPGRTMLFPARSTHGTSFNGWSKSKAALDKESGVTGYTLHDLRRTFATIHARIGTPIAVIEKLLNHVSGSFSGIVAVYQHHSFLPEMEKAVAAYEAYLAELFKD